jgi:hypothetical protein
MDAWPLNKSPSPGAEPAKLPSLAHADCRHSDDSEALYQAPWLIALRSIASGPNRLDDRRVTTVSRVCAKNSVHLVVACECWKFPVLPSVLSALSRCASRPIRRPTKYLHRLAY